MTRARRLCPGAEVITPDFDTFATVSASVMENFRRITPLVEVLSLDEAFLDVRGSTRRLGSPVRDRRAAARHHPRRAGHHLLGRGRRLGDAWPSWPAAGPSPTACSSCPPSSVTTLLHPLDVGELYGVGEKTRELLHRLGLVTVGDIAHTPVRTLQRAVGDHLGRHLHDLAWGVDDRQVVARSASSFSFLGDPDKSMGANETFGHDTDDRAVIVRELLRLTDRVTTRMRVAGVAGRTVTITVRFADFTTITRSRDPPEATDVTQEVYRAGGPLRTTPSGCSGPGSGWWGSGSRAWCRANASTGSCVLGEREHGWSEADRAADRVVRRFGADAVRPASLLIDLQSERLRPAISHNFARLPNADVRCLHWPRRLDRARGGSRAALRGRVASAGADGTRPRRKRTRSSPRPSAGPTCAAPHGAARSSPASASLPASAS